MVEALLSGGNTAFKVLFAAIAVLVVLAVAFWALRRFGRGRLRGAAARGRQPRLGVIDSAPVDGRRRLLLIRRDNVEHLLMIGGPTDVLVEQNIVRAAAARDVAPARAGAAADTLPRPVPLGEDSLWPLQPEPAAKIEPGTKIEPPAKIEPTAKIEPAAKVEPTLRVEPRAEPPRSEAPPFAPSRERRTRATDVLAGLAEELSRVAPPGEAGSAGERPAVRRPVRPPAAAGPGEAKAAPDANLTEMAQRLEAALRRPPRSFDKGTEKGAEKSAGGRPGEAVSTPAPEVAPAAAAEPAAPGPAVPGAGPSAPTPNAPATAPQKSAYDNLEEEMASLLGRPGGKP